MIVYISLSVQTNKHVYWDRATRVMAFDLLPARFELALAACSSTVGTVLEVDTHTFA